MINSKHIIETIKTSKIVAIIRGIDRDHILKTAEALLNGGIKVMEITLNRDDAMESIELVKRKFENEILLGAGTVLTEKQVREAYERGACFIVSPNTDEVVIKQTKDLNMISIPGAFSPTEIAKAQQLGADFVKVFPAGSLGSDYIKAVRGPLDSIPLLAVGGVNLDNMTEFLKASAVGLGIGGNLVNKSLIYAEKYDEVEKIAQSYVKKLEEV
ncbi:MAG: bifunctional 4-hydroxy-2-oxoglutarate aldolase/2-dehydro-3-deoxy-phosphogluconate aldolase [Thermoanaerobacteraceae bacterium]|nr:bifunctional 4-hydroxy-2-oxoglutarate aldolase/2-dehydro-3-deoxy-phosphogluconate aldolase [Thermoanaerobacteraceae bacterium]